MGLYAPDSSPTRRLAPAAGRRHKNTMRIMSGCAQWERLLALRNNETLQAGQNID